MPTNAQDIKRDEAILELRASGKTFREIGEQFGITRQRAQQIWERSVVPRDPTSCWCGETIPVQIGPGSRQKYCTPEHRPKAVPMSRQRGGRGVNRRSYAKCGTCKSPYGELRASSLCGDCQSEISARRRVHYARLAQTQGQVCAICGSAELGVTKTGKPRKLALDHCHATGEVRELLCTNCNLMLGNARDSAEILELGAAYIRKHATVLKLAEAA